MKKWKMGFLTVTVLLAGALAGCGGQKNEVPEDTEAGAEEAFVYNPEFYSMDADVMQMEVLGDVVYYCTPEQKFYKMQMKEPYKRETIELPAFDMDVESVQLQPMPDGSLDAIYRVWKEQAGTGAEASMETWLVNYDGDGTEVFRRDITEIIGLDGISTAVDGQGHLFFRTADNAVVTFDTDGTYKETIRADGIGALMESADGSVYGIFYGEEAGYCNGILCKLSWDSGELGQEYTGVLAGNNVADDRENGCLLRFDGEIYRYDLKTQQNEAFLKLADCNITDGSVQQMEVLSDGRILVLLNDATGDGATLAVLTKTAEADLPDYQTVTLAALSAGSNLMDAVARFNRQNKEYHIKLKEYYDPALDDSMGREGLEQAYTNLNLDMISGDCPDILNLDDDVIAEYAAKNIFLDLNDYLQKSELEILPNIADAYTFDGKLVALPTAVCIRTLVGRTEDFGNKDTITLSDMMGLPERYPGKKIFAADPQKLLQYCLTFNQSTFVDFETGECNYNREEFYQILAFCRQFEGDTANNNTSVWGALSDGGDALLYEVQIDAADDVNLLMQILETDSVSFVGYPTLDGSAGHLIEAKDGAYAISAKSGHADAAWEFLESLIKGTGKNFNAEKRTAGFPVEKSALELYFELATENPFDDDDNRRYTLIDIGNILHYVPLPEEAEQIEKLIDSAVVTKGVDAQMSSIIEEETADYFNGQKSAGETAERINSRISIYLKENN